MKKSKFEFFRSLICKQNISNNVLIIFNKLIITSFLLLTYGEINGALPVVKDDFIQTLTDGNAHFVKTQQSPAERIKMGKGQNPFAIILTCSDSRVAPEHIFDVGLGDIFVVRVAGNVVAPLEIGSIEYGVKYLKAPILVLLGHENCGAVKAAIAYNENPTQTYPTHVQEIIDKITPAVKSITEHRPKYEANKILPLTTEVNIKNIHAELLKESTIIKEAVEQGKLQILEGIFHITTGEVEWL